MSIENELRELEEKGWAAISVGDGDFYRGLVTDRTVCVEPDGLQTGRELADDIEANKSPFDDYTLDDVKVLPLGDGSALITYRATIRLTEADFSFQLYMTSVYERGGGDGGWRLVFHQQTPVKQDG
ncbi:nuclear transport factor 2 family protein [Actinomadura chibensis]|uniref:Nuclear transport factor 2 family protein n=1 Tax=Actinomadura chibensis TaxID=392828 RepID=A0A5D0NT90_9ACTN|nr:nuclear transport factor 2 family protein [Actinomadura chibensis]TYB47910.1 nuclear transport factor 2 family protein [Actinomadura chibensis]